MDVLLSIILPVFAIMAFGYAATFTPFMDEQARRGLAQFVFYFAIPVMLFRALANVELPDRINFAYLFAFYSAVILTFLVTMPLLTFVTGKDWREQILCGFGAIYGNVVLVGIPLVLEALGDAGAVPLFLLVAFHSTIQYTLITILIEGWSRGTASDTQSQQSLPRRVLRSLFSNPILLAILAGGAFNLSGFTLPSLVDRFATLFGQAAVPCALFSLGASLSGYRITGRMPILLTMTAGKLLVLPLVFWVLGGPILGLDPLYLATGLILAATPAGVNTYLFATRYKQSEAEVAATVLISTILSMPILAFIILNWVNP